MRRTIPHAQWTNKIIEAGHEWLILRCRLCSELPTPNSELYLEVIMLLAEFSITPLDKGESVSAYVSRSIDIIDKSGIPYKLGPMGTCVEGEWDQVFGVIKACFDRMSRDCNRISIAIKVDYRKGKSGRLESKIRSVEKRLDRKVRT